MRTEEPGMPARPVSPAEVVSVEAVDAPLCSASVLEAPLDETEAAEVARVLGALADPVRLRLLSLVAARGEVCSCDLEAPLGKSQPTISHHTRVLAEAGLVVGEHRGRWTWWQIVPQRLASVRRALGG
jgi:ArsR family transcriptional regulator